MEPRFLITGDRAVSIQMGTEISLEVNQKVLELQTELTEHPIEGITEMVPTYASLMVHYDPRKIRAKQLIEEIQSRFGKRKTTVKREKVIREIPILYGGELGPDLELCAELEGTTV